jgi:hypothetical protein
MASRLHAYCTTRGIYRLSGTGQRIEKVKVHTTDAERQVPGCNCRSALWVWGVLKDSSWPNSDNHQALGLPRVPAPLLRPRRRGRGKCISQPRSPPSHFDDFVNLGDAAHQQVEMGSHHEQRDPCRAWRRQSKDVGELQVQGAGHHPEQEHGGFGEGHEAHRCDALGSGRRAAEVGEAQAILGAQAQPISSNMSGRLAINISSFASAARLRSMVSAI